LCNILTTNYKGLVEKKFIHLEEITNLCNTYDFSFTFICSDVMLPGD